jgi:hypothetical protein
MKQNSMTAQRRWWSADFFSPRDFVRRAVLILVVFVVVQLCGLREYTSVLNGTTGSVGMNPHTAALLGMLYVLVYLGTILGVPMLLIAAALMTIWNKRQGRS